MTPRVTERTRSGKKNIFQLFLLAFACWLLDAMFDGLDEHWLKWVSEFGNRLEGEANRAHGRVDWKK